MTEAGLLVAAILLCLLGNGFFSGSEIAVISARRSRIEALIAEGSRAARRVKDLQDNIDHFLATVQIGVTLMGTLAGVLGGYLASKHLEPWLRSSAVAPWIPPAFEAAFVVGACIVYVELIVGELVPKALALRFTESAALLVSWPFELMGRASRWVDRAAHGLDARRAAASSGSATSGPHLRLRGGDQAHGEGGEGAGGPGPDRGGPDPQRLRVLRDAGQEGHGPAPQDLRPRRRHVPRRGRAAHHRERLLPHPGLRRVSRQRRWASPT